MTREAPAVFTEADRALCRNGRIDNQDLIRLAIFGWLQASAAGRTVPAEQNALVRDALAGIVAGIDPRKIFGWPPSGKKPLDKRQSKDVWRKQRMAAETLRLVRQGLADDEADAAEYVADAFRVSSKTVTRALADWRGELEAGDLVRHMVDVGRGRAAH
jgi:hypothetical protein